MYQFELFELILLLKFKDKRFPVEQFGATVSSANSTLPPSLRMDATPINKYDLITGAGPPRCVFVQPLRCLDNTT